MIICVSVSLDFECRQHEIVCRAFAQLRAVFSDLLEWNVLQAHSRNLTRARLTAWRRRGVCTPLDDCGVQCVLNPSSCTPKSSRIAKNLQNDVRRQDRRDLAHFLFCNLQSISASTEIPMRVAEPHDRLQTVSGPVALENARQICFVMRSVAATVLAFAISEVGPMRPVVEYFCSEGVDAGHGILKR